MDMAFTKWTWHLPNGHKIYQMVINYTQIFHSLEPPTYTQNGIFGVEIYHLATLVHTATTLRKIPLGRKNRLRKKCFCQILDFCSKVSVALIIDKRAAHFVT
jgi:hypothetical protein